MKKSKEVVLRQREEDIGYFEDQLAVSQRYPSKFEDTTVLKNALMNLIIDFKSTIRELETRGVKIKWVKPFTEKTYKRVRLTESNETAKYVKERKKL